MSWQVRTLPDRYADSVRLMGIARALRGRDGIAACEVAMGTPANLAALADLGARADASPGDVVIAVDGDGDGVEQALAEAERMLAGGSGGGSADGAAGAPARPRSLGAAAAALGGANVALVSEIGRASCRERV